MTSRWNQTEDANRLVMIVVAVALLAVVIGGLVIGQRLFGQESQQIVSLAEQDAQSMTTLPPQSAKPDLKKQTSASSTTTTTLLNGKTEAQIYNPEASILDSDQLAAVWNQQTSGLTPNSYRTATDIAGKFVKALSTGQGVNAFSAYFDELPPVDPWVTNYKQVYVYAEATDKARYVKAIVWYTGVETRSGLRLKQVKQGFYLERPELASLDFKPVDVLSKDNESMYNEYVRMDSDYGIKLTG